MYIYIYQSLYHGVDHTKKEIQHIFFAVDVVSCFVQCWLKGSGKGGYFSLLFHVFFDEARICLTV